MAGFDLAELARPVTRAQAIRTGLLVDTSAAAAFLGFTCPAAMTAAAWDELVGTPGIAATRQERQDAADALKAVWTAARDAVAAYQRRGVVTRNVDFRYRSGRATVQLLLVCDIDTDTRQPALSLQLKGETWNR